MKTTGLLPKLAFSSLVINNEKVYIFGGFDGAKENGYIYYLSYGKDKEQPKKKERPNIELYLLHSQIHSIFLLEEDTQWTVEKSFVTLNECMLCNEEGGICDFSRQLFSYGTYENELHVFGGIREGEVLQDLIVINMGIDVLLATYQIYVDKPSC